MERDHHQQQQHNENHTHQVVLLNSTCTENEILHSDTIKFYTSNGYLLLVEYLLYIEQEQEREEIKKTSSTLTNLTEGLDKFPSRQTNQPSDEYKSIQAADTIEDVLIGIDLKAERSAFPKFLDDFEMNCLFFGFEWFHHSLMSNLATITSQQQFRMDPITSLFCRNPSKEAFLMFLQRRIHTSSIITTDGSFSKRMDVDSVRDLRNKFIEKTFLKVTSSLDGNRVNFPSSLKTREKKTDFLLQVCNSTIENNLQDENVANYSDKFFGSFLKSKDASSKSAESVSSLPDSIDESIVEKDITIAKRIIGGCYRNVLILYFIQIIFASGVSSINGSQQQQGESSESSSSIFHFSKEYNILMKQILHVTSLMSIIVKEYDQTDQSNSDYLNYRNVALRNIVLEIYEEQEKQHKTKVRLPLEKLFHTLVHENMMTSYIYLCKQVKRQMELHGYGSSNVEILTRDVLWWIFKVFNSIKVMDKNEKEKISKEQERGEYVGEPTQLTDQKKITLVELISQTEQLLKPQQVEQELSSQNLVRFYSSPEFEEDFPFDQILAQHEENKKKSKISFL